MEAFYSTVVDATAEQVLTWYSMRWSAEVTFHDSKQHLGFEDPQGWSEDAVQRTAPMAMLLYTVIVYWYALKGRRRRPRSCLRTPTERRFPLHPRTFRRISDSSRGWPCTSLRRSITRTSAESSTATSSHRILMIDEAGKVWVTDFGLARFDHQSNLTVSGDLVGTLRYMSPEQTRSGRLVDHRTHIDALAFSNDCHLLASGYGDGTARIFDVESGLATGPKIRHEAGITDIVFACDNDRVVTASWDGTVRFWDAGFRGPVSVLAGGAGQTHVRFSRDGMILGRRRRK